MNIRPDTLRHLLEQWPVAHLASVTPAGRAHVVPIVFVHDHDHLVTPIDGKRKDGGRLQRLRNLEANPDVEIVIDHYDANWENLWWVRLSGVAREIKMDAALETKLRAKYPQYENLGGGALSDTATAVTWSRVVAWAQSGDEEAIREAVRRLG